MMFGLMRRRTLDQMLADIQRAADEITVRADESADLPARENLYGMARGLRVAAASITDKLDGIMP